MYDFLQNNNKIGGFLFNEKIYFYFLVAAMAAGCLAGCGQKKSNEQSDSTDDGKLKVVTTIFPEYDWVKEIAGDKASNMDPTLLLDNGVDLHSYQPTSDDILKISDCDLFVYVGGESDGWVDDALKSGIWRQKTRMQYLRA